MAARQPQALTGDASGPPSPSRSTSESPPPPPYRPALPSRSTELLTPHYNASRATAAVYSQPTTFSWSDQDPRSTSTQSLLPRPASGEKRTLLLIYVHGFMGDETSFQSFPAHVHNEITQLLWETHVVHTKIYPRYRSRRAIEFARDDFSRWLGPHESPRTDVVLLGHSMGGLLSAEVALLPPPSPDNPQTFLHRILGTVNFDTPFLGMHPGVVKSGLSSLLRGADEPMPTQGGTSPITAASQARSIDESTALRSSQSLQSRSSGTNSYLPSSATPTIDPNYNPPFSNDVNLPIRKTWENALHFVSKHSDNLTQAARVYVKSHIEFGSAMADYKSLKARYQKIRAQEDVDDQNVSPAHTFRPPRRIRFVNLYTASTGRLEKPRTPSASYRGAEQEDATLEPGHTHNPNQLYGNQGNSSKPESPQPPIESIDGETSGVANLDQHVHERTEAASASDVRSEGNYRMEVLDPTPYADEDEDEVDPQSQGRAHSIDEEASASQKVPEAGDALDNHSGSAATDTGLSLPPIPEEPVMPVPFDAAVYADKDARKLAEKDYQRRMKAFSQAMKNREKTIKDRRKIVEKRERNLRKEHGKLLKADQKFNDRQEKDRLKDEAQRMKTEMARLRGEDLAAGEQSLPLSNIQTHTDSASSSKRSINNIGSSSKAQREIPRKERNFCMLPSKGPDGTRDTTWLRIFMEDVDVVGAHCGLFFCDKPHYDGLVTDVGRQIFHWVTHAEEVQRISTRAE